MAEISRSTPYHKLPDYMSRDEVMAYLDISQSTFYRWVRSGRLRSWRAHNRGAYFIPKKAIWDMERPINSNHLGGNDT